MTITGPVETYFGQVFCVITGCSHQITASVKGMAEFTLPVPMGSPQNYYGVGTYVYNQINTNTTTPTTAATPAGTPRASYQSGTGWTNPANAPPTTTTTRTPRPTHGPRRGIRSGCSRAATACPMTRPSSIDGHRGPACRRLSLQRQRRDELHGKGRGQLERRQLMVVEPEHAARSARTTSSDQIVGSSSSTSGWGSPFVVVRRLQQQQLPRPPDLVKRYELVRYRSAGKPGSAAGPRHLSHRHRPRRPRRR